jgi:hypothetical protein
MGQDFFLVSPMSPLISTSKISPNISPASGSRGRERSEHNDEQRRASRVHDFDLDHPAPLTTSSIADHPDHGMVSALSAVDPDIYRVGAFLDFHEGMSDLNWIT